MTNALAREDLPPGAAVGRKPKPRKPEGVEPEIQQGAGRSRVMDDRLKRIVKQHPKRDEPRVESVEKIDTPSG